MKFKNSSVNLIAKYKFNSIFFKYYKFIILATLVPFLILNSVIYTNNYVTEKKALSRELNYNATTCTITIDTLFNTIDQINAEFFTNASCNYLLHADRTNSDDEMIVNSYMDFKNISNNFIKSNPLIASIHLYAPYSGYVYSTNNSNYIEHFQNAIYIKKYIENNRRNKILETETRGEQYITFFASTSMNTEHPGILLVQIHKQNLYNTLKRNEIQDANTNFKLINSQTGEVIVDFNNNTDFNNKFSSEIIKTTSDSDINFQITTDLNILKYSLKSILKTTLPYIIFTFVVTVIIAYLISINFYKSVTQIITNIEKSTTNSLELSKDELSYINESILGSINYAKNLENELAEKITKLEKNQIVALQSQINPHFLFNSLTSVHGLIFEESGKETDSMKMLNLICNLYGDLINNRSYITSVTDEINYAKKYIEIELIRNSYSFNIKWIIDEEIKEYYCLKMILQPIIENAITHGIKELDYDKLGVLIIKAFKNENDLYFKIIDNGSGMNEETLKNLNDKLSSSSETSSKHIGLVNINSRIKILYGDNYGVSVKSDYKGTEVTIKLPIIKEI